MHVLSFTVTILPNMFYLEMRRRLKTSVKLLVFPVLYNCSVGIQEKIGQIYPSVAFC